jgi:predicted MFS family arabinose efflux permease
VTFLASALLLLSVRAPEAPPPPRSEREPVLDEIRHGLRLVRASPILRAFVGAQMLMSMLWGVFGATWFLFAIEEVGVSPAALGVIAGVGGASFIGAVVATRSTGRWGVGPVAIASMLLAALGNLLVPLAPAGLPIVAIAFFLWQQLVADSAITVYDVTETSVRQSLVADRELGRVASTFQVASAGAQLLAEVIGLRATAFLAPLGGLFAAAILFWSPVRYLREVPTMDRRSPAEIALDVEKDQPVGA